MGFDGGGGLLVDFVLLVVQGPAQRQRHDNGHQCECADLVPADGSQPKSINETPFDALWYMMAYARDLPDGTVDWDAAPELDHDHLQEVVHDPRTWRGRPFRIPISRIQDARVLRASISSDMFGNWLYFNPVF